MTGVAANCRSIFRRIEDAAARSGRLPQAVRLVAVTKTVRPEKIREAIACGVTDIGESKLQEALTKRDALADMPVQWHFIGHLQTNKARKAVETFHWIHSIDRVELAETLARHNAGIALPVLIEVKLHEDSMKSGVLPSGLRDLVARLREMQSLDLRGLMAIPPPADNPEDTRPYFRRLREMAEEHNLTELSMGMTQDFEVAIEEGATMVRIGTGLFGDRQ